MNRTRDAYRDLKLRCYDQLTAPGKLKKTDWICTLSIYVDATLTTSLPHAEFGAEVAPLEMVNEYVRHWVRGQLPGDNTEGGH